MIVKHDELLAMASDFRFQMGKPEGLPADVRRECQMCLLLIAIAERLDHLESTLGMK